MGGLFPSGRAMQMTEQVFQAKGLIPAGMPSGTPAAPPVTVDMTRGTPPAPPMDLPTRQRAVATTGAAIAQRQAASTIAGGYGAQKLGG